MEIYVIQETDVGEAECQGRIYSNLIIFEKNAINDLINKYMTENKIAEKIAREENCSIEDVLPENNIWTFDDFMEVMDNEYEKDESNHIEYNLDVSSYDLNDIDDLRRFCMQVKEHKEADSHFPLNIESEVLYKNLGKENIENINISDKFSFDLVEAIIVKFDDKVIFL